MNQRDHRKILIVDGRVVFLGGININSVYSGGSFRPPRSPTSMLSCHGATRTFRSRVPWLRSSRSCSSRTWQAQQGEPLAPRNFYPDAAAAGQRGRAAIGSSPDDDFSLIYATLLSAIGSAESEVGLTNAVFVSDPQLPAALEAAAARAVDVRLVLPGSSDSALVFNAGRSYYEQLLRGGVTDLRTPRRADDRRPLSSTVWSTVVGSTNLDWRSFLHNQEVNAVVLGTGFGD